MGKEKLAGPILSPSVTTALSRELCLLFWSQSGEEKGEEAVYPKPREEKPLLMTLRMPQAVFFLFYLVFYLPYFFLHEHTPSFRLFN